MSIDRTYAPEDLKRTQEVLLDILKDVIRVCDQNGITIFAEGGTAIGAVRHNGFIPWDDDIDICILREDWDKFIDALNKDLSDDFYFQCYENDKNFKLDVSNRKMVFDVIDKVYTRDLYFRD